MPKLSENNPLLISAILLLILFGLFAYFLYPNFFYTQSQTKTPTAQKQSYTLFNGQVVVLDQAVKTLTVKSGNDNKDYHLVLSTKGKVLLNSQNSDFSEIKLGDQVNVYSSSSGVDSSRPATVETIVIVRVTPEILKRITN